MNIPPLSSGLDQERWDRLLKWLDADTNRAGEKYEWIRTRLIKIFVSRGSSTSDELADVTIDRVATRLAEIQDGYVGERLSYFYGVAKNVYRESLRKDKVPAIKPPPTASSDEDKEREFACLETCMATLQAEDRNLVIEYYRYEKRIKIDHRKSLAEQMGLGMNALRIRACRIRSELQKCVGACLAGTAAEFAK